MDDDPSVVTSVAELSPVLADIFAVHRWEDDGGCGCRGMKDGEDYTHHVADQVINKIKLHGLHFVV